MSDLPEITEVQRLTIRPGDSIVIKLPGPVSPDAASHAAERVRVLLGLDDRIPVLVLPADATFEVLEPAPEEISR